MAGAWVHLRHAKRGAQTGGHGPTSACVYGGDRRGAARAGALERGSAARRPPNSV
jgi:hypothetical protein